MNTLKQSETAQIQLETNPVLLETVRRLAEKNGVRLDQQLAETSQSALHEFLNLYYRSEDAQTKMEVTAERMRRLAKIAQTACSYSIRICLAIPPKWCSVHPRQPLFCRLSRTDPVRNPVRIRFAFLIGLRRETCDGGLGLDESGHGGRISWGWEKRRRDHPE